jgi:hypothetical protein
MIGEPLSNKKPRLHRQPGLLVWMIYPENDLRERLWLGATYTSTGFLADTTF